MTPFIRIELMSKVHVVATQRKSVNTPPCYNNK